jgi:hypothetical protein
MAESSKRKKRKTAEKPKTPSYYFSKPENFSWRPWRLGG